jgi:excisionase family DNA binding protein
VSTTPLAEASARAAKVAAYRVHNILRTHPDDEVVPLRDPDGDEDLTVPRGAAELLQRILAAMAAGTPVTVVPDHAELTTQQAADLLGVSRPYLIGILERGEIDYRMVGTHRRVRADSLRAYSDRMIAEQRSAADELTRIAAEAGLY